MKTFILESRRSLYYESFIPGPKLKFLRRTSKWGLALEFQVSGLYPLCGSVPLSGMSSHLKMALFSAHRMLFRTAGELLVR